jgi:muramoyltetrapeptide carboxypeptidase
LVGGNLQALTTLMGTEYEPDWKNKILFWEEVGEMAEDINFHLTHLRLCGVSDKIRGMAIGQFKVLPLGDDLKNQKTFSINKIILEICKDYKFPIIKNVAFGHVYPQATIPIGVKATIDTSKKLFSIDEAGVK